MHHITLFSPPTNFFSTVFVEWIPFSVCMATRARFSRLGAPWRLLKRTKLLSGALFFWNSVLLSQQVFLHSAVTCLYRSVHLRQRLESGGALHCDFFSDSGCRNAFSMGSAWPATEASCIRAYSPLQFKHFTRPYPAAMAAVSGLCALGVLVHLFVGVREEL